MKYKELYTSQKLMFANQSIFQYAFQPNRSAAQGAGDGNNYIIYNFFL
jgi:hypothetical protein